MVRFILALTALSFTACATHAPMSEMIMFSEKKVLGDNPGLDSASVHYSKFSFGLSGQGTFIDRDLLKKFAEEQGESIESSPQDFFGSLGVNLIFLSDKTDDLGVSVSILPTFGIDGTIRIYDNKYFTYGYTVLGGHQFIFQQRLSYNQRTAFSAGMFYDRINQYLYSDCNDCFYFGPDVVITNNVVGVRLLLLSHNGSKNRSFFNANGKFGYVYDTGSPYLSVGASFGIF